jgi:radical SAM protein with 4Fe4S-binding SPASM domain
MRIQNYLYGQRMQRRFYQRSKSVKNCYRQDTSFDPGPHIRGFGKKINSVKYNQMFMKGVGLLEKYGFGWGLIYVVTRKSLIKPVDVFSFLTNLKLDGGFNMNPVLIYDNKCQNIAITPEEYVEFLGAIFPTWWKHQDRYPGVEPFRSLTRSIKDGIISLGCVDSGNCAYNHLNIDPNGDTSQCGRSSDWGLLNYGNIHQKTLSEIMKDEQRNQFVERNELLQKTVCKGCRFWTLCHGGCPLYAYAEHGNFMHKSKWCEAKRRFIEKYFEPITGIKFKQI